MKVMRPNSLFYPELNKSYYNLLGATDHVYSIRLPEAGVLEVILQETKDRGKYYDKPQSVTCFFHFNNTMELVDSKPLPESLDTSGDDSRFLCVGSSGDTVQIYITKQSEAPVDPVHYSVQFKFVGTNDDSSGASELMQHQQTFSTLGPQLDDRLDWWKMQTSRNTLSNLWIEWKGDENLLESSWYTKSKNANKVHLTAIAPKKKILNRDNYTKVVYSEVNPGFFSTLYLKIEPRRELLHEVPYTIYWEPNPGDVEIIDPIIAYLGHNLSHRASQFKGAHWWRFTPPIGGTLKVKIIGSNTSSHHFYNIDFLDEKGISIEQFKDATAFNKHVVPSKDYYLRIEQRTTEMQLYTLSMMIETEHIPTGFLFVEHGLLIQERDSLKQQIVSITSDYSDIVQQMLRLDSLIQNLVDSNRVLAEKSRATKKELDDLKKRIAEDARAIFETIQENRVTADSDGYFNGSRKKILRDFIQFSHLPMELIAEAKLELALQLAQIDKDYEQACRFLRESIVDLTNGFDTEYTISESGCGILFRCADALRKYATDVSNLTECQENLNCLEQLTATILDLECIPLEERNNLKIKIGACIYELTQTIEN